MSDDRNDETGALDRARRELTFAADHQRLACLTWREARAAADALDRIKEDQ